MKKILSTLIVLLFFPTYSYAMVDSEYWSYQFHLEYDKGVLQVERGVDYPYSPVPVEYNPVYDPAKADFYGVIINIKNKEDARFGFMAPTTTTVTLGKSLFSVWAPKYADADHVSIYSKTNKHLFDISVKDSSFCNDNDICDENIGESRLNCPNDCHTLPPSTVEPTVSPATPEPVNTPPTATPVVAPTSYTQIETGGQITTTTSTKAWFTPGIIMMLIGGTLLIVLGIVLLRIRKNMD